MKKCVPVDTGYVQWRDTNDTEDYRSNGKYIKWIYCNPERDRGCKSVIYDGRGCLYEFTTWVWTNLISIKNAFYLGEKKRRCSGDRISADKAGWDDRGICACFINE